MKTLLPGPETESLRALKVLKQGPHGTAVLVQETVSGELLVARQVPVTDNGTEVVDVLEQSPAFLDDPGLAPMLAILTRHRQVWAVSEFVLGYPLDYAATQGRFGKDLVLQWARQLLRTLSTLHDESWILGTLEPSDVVVGVQGACLVDLHLFEHAYPQRAARARMNERSPFWAPEVGRSFTLSPAADVYSVGALATWLLTGDAAGDTPPELADLVAPDPQQRPTAADAAATLAEASVSVYQVLPVLNVHIPVPWLDAGFQIETAQVSKSLATTGRRLREAKPEATPPAVEESPSLAWMAPMEWLDDFTWAVFRGDGRKLAATLVVLGMAIGALFWLSHAGAAASSPKTHPTPDKGGLSATDGHFYARARGQKAWASVTSTQRLEGELLSSPRRPTTTIVFGRGSQLVLDRSSVMGYDNSPTQGFHFILRQGRAAVLLSADDAVEVEVGESHATLPPHSLVEMDARSRNGLPHVHLASFTETFHVETAGQDVTLAPQQMVVLERGTPPTVHPVPDLDDWERANLHQ